jgi:menaquinone-dependent protoporphyrinogen oxidase
MKALIAVASKHGSTREIASAIAEELRTKGMEADLKDAGHVGNLAGYDTVMLGSGIYAGNWLPEARQLVERHRAALSRLPVWLFSSGPLGTPDPQPHDDPDRIATTAVGDLPVRGHHVFAGKLDKSSLGFGERLIARAVKAPEGDFRDWDDIRTWADSIAAALEEDNAGVKGLS